MNDPIEGTVINMLRCSRISKILSVSEHYVYMDEEKHFCYLNIPKNLTFNTKTILILRDTHTFAMFIPLTTLSVLFSLVVPSHQN